MINKIKSAWTASIKPEVTISDIEKKDGEIIRYTLSCHTLWYHKLLLSRTGNPLKRWLFQGWLYMASYFTMNKIIKYFYDTFFIQSIPSLIFVIVTGSIFAIWFSYKAFKL